MLNYFDWLKSDSLTFNIGLLQLGIYINAANTIYIWNEVYNGKRFFANQMWD